MTKEAPSKQVVQIRRANQEDIIRIFKVIKEALGDTGLRYPPVDRDTAITWISDVIRYDGLVYVAEVSGRIVGSIGFQPMEFPWADKAHKNRWYYANVWLYVHQGYRKYGTAEALINKAKIFAKSAGVLLAVGTTLEKNSELKERFLRMQGLTYVGGSFLYQEHIHDPNSAEGVEVKENEQSKSILNTKADSDE